MRAVSGKMPKMKTVKVTGEVMDDGKDKMDGKGKKYDDWELEDAARTLTQAEEIKADPHKMKALQPHLEKKAKAYKSLAQLKQMGAATKVTT